MLQIGVMFQAKRTSYVSLKHRGKMGRHRKPQYRVVTLFAEQRNLAIRCEELRRDRCVKQPKTE